MAILLLLGMCGVNNHSVLGLVIYEKIGVIVVAPSPYEASLEAGIYHFS